MNAPTLYVVDLPANPAGSSSAGVLLAIYTDQRRALDLARDTPGARVRKIPPSHGHGSIYWPAIDGTVIPVA